MKVGDKIIFSPRGTGTVTGHTERGYPQVNHVACAYGIRADGRTWGAIPEPEAVGAIRTLVRMGYTTAGGRNEWRPPIGAAPVFTAEDMTTNPKKDLVPGYMRCCKCVFTLVKSNLNMGDGTITAGEAEPTPCPNGCGSMVPVTWKEYAKLLQNSENEIAERMIAAERDAARWRTLMGIPGASSRIWNHVLDDSHKTPSEVNSTTEAIDKLRAEAQERKLRESKHLSLVR